MCFTVLYQPSLQRQSWRVGNLYSRTSEEWIFRIQGHLLQSPSLLLPFQRMFPNPLSVMKLKNHFILFGEKSNWFRLSYDHGVTAQDMPFQLKWTLKSLNLKFVCVCSLSSSIPRILKNKLLFISLIKKQQAKGKKYFLCNYEWWLTKLGCGNHFAIYKSLCCTP